MKFIVWGIPLHSHTHSYVHHAFARASSHMGFETYWLPDEEKSNDIMDSNSVVLCCGVSDKNLKKIDGASYILHNSDREDLRLNNHINLQVYTHDVLSREIEKIDDLTYWEDSKKTLYQPWATDLLPEEIKKVEPVFHNKSNSVVNWVGSVTTGEHGNIDELNQYAQLCKNSEIRFLTNRLTSIEENISLVRSSRHSPVIQGKWQVEKGYIPCRLFKNISYGCWSITNSPTTANLLGLNECNSIQDMFDAGEEFLSKGSVADVSEKMKLVSEKHTYVNRIKNIVECLLEKHV